MESEQQIETKILTWLNRRKGVYAFKFPRGQKSFSRKNTVVSGQGVSDIICNVTHRGILFVVYFEVKAKTGKQRPSQAKFESLIKALQGFYFMVYSVDEVKRLMAIIETELDKKIDEIIKQGFVEAEVRKGFKVIETELKIRALKQMGVTDKDIDQIDNRSIK